MVGDLFVEGKFWWCSALVDGVEQKLRTPYRYCAKNRALALRFARKLWSLTGTESMDDVRNRKRERPTREHPLEPNEELDGVIYVIQLARLGLRYRLKVGYTSKDPIVRLRHFRTSNPEAALLATWYGETSLEKLLHRKLPGRVQASEVFEVLDVGAFLNVVDSLLGARIWSSAAALASLSNE